MSFEIDFQTTGDKRIRFGRAPWDEEAIGLPVYRVEVTGDAKGAAPGIVALTDTFCEHDQCLAVCKIAADDVSWLEALGSAGFYPVEASIEPYRELARYEPGRRFARLALRDATEDDQGAIVKIASEAFSRGRFHLDPNLPPGTGDRRYAGWVKRAFADGQCVLAFEDTKSGDVIGFYHVRDLGDGTANLALAAVDKKARGAGLGTVMYDQCLEVCKQRGFERVETNISVANTAVMNVYTQLGFHFRNPRIVLHWCER